MMPEILTESFCERCGTRYTFESTAPRKTRRIGQIKTLSKGMKNWVMSDDTSLDEAMAAARNDDDRALTSHQLDAFHATFNFCMTCRQYTCANCWNVAEGRCLTCAPHLGQEILPAAFPDQAAFEPVRIEAEAWPEIDLSATDAAAANGNGHDHLAPPDGLDPWASAGATDVDEIPDFDPAARLAFLSGETPLAVVEPEPSAVAEAEPAPVELIGDTPEPAWQAIDDQVAATAAEVEETLATTVEPDVAEADEAIVAAMAETEAPTLEIEAASAPPVIAAPPPVREPLPVTVEGKTDVGLARTMELLRRFRPGQNLDDEIAAYEASIQHAAEPAAAAAEPEPVAAAAEPEPVAAAAAPEPEPLAEPEPIAVASAAPEAESEPEPIAAAPEPEAEAVVAAPEPEPEPIAAAPEPEPEPVAAAPEPEPIAAAAALEPEPEPVQPSPAPLSPLSQPTPAAPATPAPIAAEAPREDRILQPTWQIYAPDATPAATPPAVAPTSPVTPVQPPVAPQPPAASAAPQWPVRPDAIESPSMALFTNRAGRSSSDGLWAASAQEVLATPINAPAPTSGVQPCSSCGLSLSATARFCRRCGTRQG
jgi:ribosomal protein L40E